MDNSSNIFRGNPAHTVLDNHTKSLTGACWTDETALVEGAPGQRIMMLQSQENVSMHRPVSDWYVGRLPSTDSWLCPSACSLVNSSASESNPTTATYVIFYPGQDNRTPSSDPSASQELSSRLSSGKQYSARTCSFFFFALF